MRSRCNEFFNVWQHLHFMLIVSWSRSEAAMIHRSGSEVTATFVASWSVHDGFRAPSIVIFALAPLHLTHHERRKCSWCRTIAAVRLVLAILHTFFMISAALCSVNDDQQYSDALYVHTGSIQNQ